MALGSPEMAYRLARRGFGLPLSTDLYYVIHNANWAIDWVGHYITSHIQSQFDWSTQLTTTPYTLVNHIIHFGDLWSALSSIKFQPHRYNKVVATIFHGDRDETEPALAHMVDQFVEYSANLDRVVTACRIMEKRLLSW